MRVSRTAIPLVAHCTCPFQRSPYPQVRFWGALVPDRFCPRHGRIKRRPAVWVGSRSRDFWSPIVGVVIAAVLRR